MDNTLSLEKMPSAFSLFQHYADSSVQSDQKTLNLVPGKNLFWVHPCKGWHFGKALEFIEH